VKPLAIHAEAEAEVEQAIAYYEGQRPGLGGEFREDLEATLNRVRQRPGAPAPIDDQGTGKVRFRRFPYTIYYVELEESIWIAAVAHQKRRPGYWSKRQP
jgi:toxin ParE1/3/4